LHAGWLEHLLEFDQIDVIDCDPCDYYYHKFVRQIGCTRPLYLINRLSILSTFDTKHDYDLMNLLKVYHWSCWLTLAAIISILILLASYNNTFWKSFWSFIDPLLSKGNSHSIKCFSYALYLFALIPFLQIIQNELLANLVAVKEIKSDTIDDLLDPKITIFMFHDRESLRRDIDKVDDFELRVKLQSLLTKIGKTSSLEDWINLTQEPDQMRRIGRNYAFMNDEYSLRWTQVS
jgi:hypothetical protein